MKDRLKKFYEEHKLGLDTAAVFAGYGAIIWFTTYKVTEHQMEIVAVSRKVADDGEMWARVTHRNGRYRIAQWDAPKK